MLSHLIFLPYLFCQKSGGQKLTDGDIEQLPCLQATSELQLKNGVLTLLYKGGDPCEAYPGFTRSAEIIFRCAKSGGTGSPVLAMNDNDCSYVFHWDTLSACSNTDEEVPCVLHDTVSGSAFDLSVLARVKGNWEV